MHIPYWVVFDINGDYIPRYEKVGDKYIDNGGEIPHHVSSLGMKTSHGFIWFSPYELKIINGKDTSDFVISVDNNIVNVIEFEPFFYYSGHTLFTPSSVVSSAVDSANMGIKFTAKNVDFVFRFVKKQQERYCEFECQSDVPCFVEILRKSSLGNKFNKAVRFKLPSSDKSSVKRI